MPRKLIVVLLSFIILIMPGYFLAGQTERQEVTTPCNAHLASLSDNSPHAYEKYFEWTTTPRVAVDVANAKLPNTVDVIAVAPVTAKDYTTIFPHDDKDAIQTVTQAQQTEIEAVQSTLKATFGKDQGDRDFNDKNYKQILQTKSSSFLIVIGHNEHGMMHMLDGTTLYLDEIATAGRPDQRVILISCDSADYVSSENAAAINGKLTYEQAFQIADHLSNFIKAAGGPVSLTQIKKELTRTVDEAGTGYKVSLFIVKVACGVGAAIAVGLIIRAADPCDAGSRTPGCPENPHKVKTGPKNPDQAPKLDKKPSASGHRAPLEL